MHYTHNFGCTHFLRQNYYADVSAAPANYIKSYFIQYKNHGLLKCCNEYAIIHKHLQDISIIGIETLSGIQWQGNCCFHWNIPVFILHKKYNIYNLQWPFLIFLTGQTITNT